MTIERTETDDVLVAVAESAEELLAHADDLTAAGDPVTARELARRARDEVLEARAWNLVPAAASTLGWAAALSGDVARAAASFTTAGEFRRGLARADVHLDGTPGIRWAAFLVRTTRWDDARELLERCITRAAAGGRPVEVAVASTELAALHLEQDLPETALGLVREATGVLDADGRPSQQVRGRLVLAHALSAVGLHDEAQAVAEDAVRRADGLDLVTLLADGLAVRSRVVLAADGGTAADGAVATARADAQEALWLARRHHLAWAELDALLAHAAVDRVEETLRGEPPTRPLPGSYIAQAGYLLQRFNAGWSDPHPLSTVIARVGR